MVTGSKSTTGGLHMSPLPGTKRILSHSSETHRQQEGVRRQQEREDTDTSDEKAHISETHNPGSL